MQQCALAVSRRCNVTEGAGGCDEKRWLLLNEAKYYNYSKNGNLFFTDEFESDLDP